MDKRYQVFVSSSYLDLHEERQQVMQALLELDCIPAGMELFPASDQEKWALITRVITAQTSEYHRQHQHGIDVHRISDLDDDPQVWAPLPTLKKRLVASARVRFFRQFLVCDGGRTFP